MSASRITRWATQPGPTTTWAPALNDENFAMLNQANLASFVTYNPLTLRVDTRLVEAIQMLAETGIHHWPVVDDQQRLVGMLSDHDILRSLRQRTGAMALAVAGRSAFATDFEDSANDDTKTLQVKDAMSEPMDSVTSAERPREVLRKLLDQQAKWFPVLDGDMVVGVTTVTDFLREFSYGQLSLSKMQGSEVMEPVEVIGSDATLSDAWDVLLEQPLDCLGVVRGDLPLGVLTERDLRLAQCRVAVSEWLTETGVDEFECKGPRTVLELVSAAPTIRPGARLKDAATLMLDQDRQAIAVVNQANRMMGAVTEHGLLRRMLNYLI